jgi:hypothetical protein
MTFWEFMCAQGQWAAMNVPGGTKSVSPEDQARLAALAEAMPQTLSE